MQRRVSTHHLGCDSLQESLAREPSENTNHSLALPSRRRCTTAKSDRVCCGRKVPRFADVAHVFREQSRQSDVVGHVGDSRFAILAPDTDAAGARLLWPRLQQSSIRQPETKHRRGDSAARRLLGVPDLASANVNVAS